MFVKNCSDSANPVLVKIRKKKILLKINSEGKTPCGYLMILVNIIFLDKTGRKNK